jgi:hypothetical protein
LITLCSSRVAAINQEMHTTRIIINVLALVLGTFGLAWAIMGPGMLLAIATGYLAVAPAPADRLFWTWGATSFAAFGILGFFVARQAWHYKRQPNRDHARVVLRSAAVLMGFYAFGAAEKYALLPKLGGTWGPSINLLVALAAIWTGYLVYRVLLQRVADRAFPVTATEPGVH